MCPARSKVCSVDDVERSVAAAELVPRDDVQQLAAEDESDGAALTVPQYLEERREAGHEHVAGEHRRVHVVGLTDDLLRQLVADLDPERVADVRDGRCCWSASPRRCGGRSSSRSTWPTWSSWPGACA